METLLSAIGAFLIAGLLYLGYLEWQKADKERKITIVSRLIKAAELAVQSGAGADKKAWVMERLQRYLPHTTPEELDEMVEAAVFELKRMIGIKPTDSNDDNLDFWIGSGRAN